MNLLAVLSIPAPLPWAGCGSQASRAVQCRSSPSSGCEWCQGCLSVLTPPACAQGKHGWCHSEMGCARTWLCSWSLWVSAAVVCCSQCSETIREMQHKHPSPGSHPVQELTSGSGQDWPQCGQLVITVFCV